jgi:hypothetical protein
MVYWRNHSIGSRENMEERKKTAITPQRLKGRWTIDYVWAFLQKRIFTFRSG